MIMSRVKEQCMWLRYLSRCGEETVVRKICDEKKLSQLFI